MPQWRPPNAELADVSEHIIAGRLGAVLDPGDKIVKGGLSHRVLDPTMPGLEYRALHQKMRRPGLLDASAVTLLQRERDAESRRLVDRHHRHSDPTGEFGEGLGLIRASSSPRR